MGFEIDDGPEVELASYNFDRLNTDEGHPAREWTDTFYLDEASRTLLRTHTRPWSRASWRAASCPSAPPCSAAATGKDEVDATHSPMFHQMEGLVVDKHITFADLKGASAQHGRQMYGPGTVTRFRPHHFLHGPSCEMDVQCHKCGGAGCPPARARAG